MKFLISAFSLLCVLLLTGCATTTSNQRVVSNYVKNYNERNLEGLLGQLGDNFQVIQNDRMQFETKEEFIDSLRADFILNTKIRVEFKEERNGDVVVLQTIRDDFDRVLGFPSIRTDTIYEIKNAKIETIYFGYILDENEKKKNEIRDPSFVAFIRDSAFDVFLSWCQTEIGDCKFSRNEAGAKQLKNALERYAAHLENQ